MDVASPRTVCSSSVRTIILRTLSLTLQVRKYDPDPDRVVMMMMSFFDDGFSLARCSLRSQYLSKQLSLVNAATAIFQAVISSIRRRMTTILKHVSVLLHVVLAKGATSDLVISEIADKGSQGVCSDGNDWLELYNSGPENVDLAGFILHDDNGISSSSAFTFPADSSRVLLSQEYLLLCTREDTETSPQFGIGGDDTITLVDASGAVVDTVGPLPDTDNAFGVSYAWNETDGSYIYTTTPTPVSANNLTRVPPPETSEERKARLALQNAKGTKFFGMDDRGYPVVDAYDQVLDLHMTMTEEDFEYLKKNVSYEVYKPFLNATIFQDGKEILSLSSPGRIRPKGQSTLFIGACMGSPTVPFQIDFDHTNSAQTLFGVERAYLRMHLGDNSYMRDWVHHRMLARFGLPHLRARKVRFFINGEKQGFYTLLEAPDQEYVFARSFPSYNPSSFALFKVKSLSIGCGLYSDGELEKAQLRINETNTPPYFFERGEHRKRIDVLGWWAFGECLGGFYEQFGEMRADTILAYLRYNKECASMLVDEGLIDLDIGSKEWEDAMKPFIADNLATKTCTAGCANSNLASEVDQENFLKNFAVYAVTLNQDSPMGNGNNYYLAEAGDGTGWKIVPYDHNTAGDATCDPSKCNEHLIHWSIIRPTCGSLESNQLAGPLLSNLELHTKYIEYVRSFVDTVLTNQSFIEEMSNHAQAIQDDVTQDFWSTGGVYYSQELSPDASGWNSPQMPFLPMLKARAEDVYSQLEALDAGTFPRGPHLEVNTEPDEKCVDWRTTEPPAPICYEDCEYAGCLKVGWTVPAFCDERTATCYHGDYDVKCKGLAVGDRYDGMENREGGFATFCSVEIDGVTPIKASECPPEPIGQCSEPTDCIYDGCHIPDWSVASTCSDEGICYHADLDEKCRNVPRGQRYEGMESQVDGRVAFCAEEDGTPLKVSECPLPDETTAPTGSPTAINPEPTTRSPMTNETETPSKAMHSAYWWVPAFLTSWVVSMYCFV